MLSFKTGALLGAIVGAALIGKAAPALAATDVVIAFDTTGSMSGALSEAKSEVNDVIAQVDRRFGDVRYAVAAVKDYGSSYGADGDQPWELVQPLTADRSAIGDAISGLSAVGGGDPAEAYGRALMETDTNPAVGFRAGAQRLVVLVADNVPHDDDLNEGIPPAVQTEASPFDTGVDPGRDELVGTADDIDWQRELGELRAHNIPLYLVLFEGSSRLLPYWRTWAASTGGSAYDAGTGELGSALVESISAGSAGCGRAYARVGVVDVCADQIVERGDGTQEAMGAVRLSTGVDAGAGPVVIDPGAQMIASVGSGSLAVVRGGSTVPFASGAFTIATGGVRDDISGRANLAPLSIAGQVLGSTLVGGLGMSPLGKYYVDPADGGGFVLTANPLIQLLGQGPTGTLALGLHAGSLTRFRVLGGSAGWNLKFGPTKARWGLGMMLQYTGADDTWHGEGEAGFPNVLPGVKVSGALRSGRIDAVGIAIKDGQAGVPLGSSGFFLDSFSGELAGLVTAPLRITLGVTGGWGVQVPVVQKRPLSLETAELSVASDYSGSLKGRVGIIDRRMAGGDLNISMSLAPTFRASGKLNASVAFLGTGYFARGAVDMNPKHFTATGGADFELAGRRMHGTSAIISDEGTGASGRACGICPTIGVGIRWRDALRFPPRPEWIGADIERYRTTVAAASAGTLQRTTRVQRGTAVLAVYADPGAGVPADVELVAPNGRRIRLDRPGPNASVVRADDGRMALTVLQPLAGRWTVIRRTGSGVQVQRVPPLGTIVARAPAPRGTRKHPLKVKRSVRVRWRVSGRLPAGTRVTLQRAPKGKRGGVPVATVKATRRSVVVKGVLLRKGANKLSLILSAGGVPFRRIAVPGTVYRK